MLFGLLIGAFSGLLFGCSRHPLLGFAGIFVGGGLGMTYAGLMCLACGATLDLWVNAIRCRRYLIATFGAVLWLATCYVFIVGAFMLLYLAAK